MSSIQSIIEQCNDTVDESLLKDLYKSICKTKDIDIDYFMKPEENKYVIMFMMTLIAKIKGNECFRGDIFTPKRYQFVIDNKNNESIAIRRLAKKVLQQDNLNYYIGSFLGQCIGDALGFIVEGTSAVKCKEYIEEFIEPLKVPLKFGQYSDDSQLARELYVAVYQNDGVLNPAVYANRIACLFQPGHYRIVGYGRTTAQAGEALYNGRHYTESGIQNTFGNGAAMRAAPFGLLLHDRSTSEICDTVSVFSSITHASEQCIQGSIMIALATRASFNSKKEAFIVSRFLSEVVVGIKDVMYKAEILNIINLLDNDDFAKKRFVFFGKGLGEKQWGDGISTGVYQSTLWALYSFCKYPDDYIKCISLAISCGGDVDTTAAMAGAIIGARLGREKLPTIYTNKLVDINIWNTEELVKLVKRVYDP
jgi:ADP-ribosylglycohydrolase